MPIKATTAHFEQYCAMHHAMNAQELIYGRRSVRSYEAKAVPQQLIGQLIDAAIQAPSAMDQQPWLFTVIRDLDLLNEISTYAKAHVLAGEIPNSPSRLHATLSDPHFHIFYHAPALIVISAPDKDLWFKEDCALAGQNLMLAACDHGLGSCWVGFAQHWLATRQGRNAIRLPPEYAPVAPIIIGYPKTKAEHSPRHPPEDRVGGRKILRALMRAP